MTAAIALVIAVVANGRMSFGMQAKMMTSDDQHSVTHIKHKFACNLFITTTPFVNSYNNSKKPSKSPHSFLGSTDQFKARALPFAVQSACPKNPTARSAHLNYAVLPKPFMLSTLIL